MQMGDSNENEENFWKQVLSEVSSHSAKRIPKRVLILGNNGCGKTSLITKLKTPGDEEFRKGAGLEYTYLNVHDEERDEYARLSIWVQDGSTHHNELIKYALTKDSIDKLMIIICTDMSQPWNILDTLEYWSNIINQTIHSLQLSAKELNEMERKLIKEFREYRDISELAEDEIKTTKRQISRENTQDEDNLLPLGENILINNSGIPITVVVTKSDWMSNLEKEYDYNDEQFDFIQKYLRKFCLKCGASLIYTSSKDGCNVTTLYKYLLNRLYGFPLRVPPQIVEKDAIFIPMGWDNESKIGILDEHIKTFNSQDALQDHITKPFLKKSSTQEKEIIAEDEQMFLESQLVTLSKAPPSSSSQRPQQPAEHRATQRPSPNMSPGQRTNQRTGIPNPKAKIDPNKAAAAQGSSETVLANFFNSLLNKNTGAGGKQAKGTANATPAASRSDVQAELERMSKKTMKKESSA